MLRVIGTDDRNQQWLGVADIMRPKRTTRPTGSRQVRRGRAKIARVTAERVIREGDTTEQIVSLIDDDDDIVILVLAAGTGKEGPGPLVTELGKTAGTFPIPVAIVPGQLNDEDLDAMLSRQ